MFSSPFYSSEISRSSVWNSSRISFSHYYLNNNFIVRFLFLCSPVHEDMLIYCFHWVFSMSVAFIVIKNCRCTPISIVASLQFENHRRLFDNLTKVGDDSTIVVIILEYSSSEISWVVLDIMVSVSLYWTTKQDTSKSNSKTFLQKVV